MIKTLKSYTALPTHFSLLILLLLVAAPLRTQGVDSAQTASSVEPVLHRAVHGIGYKIGILSGFGVDFSSAWFGVEINSWLVHSSARLRFYPLQWNITPYVGLGIGQHFTIGHSTGPGSIVWNEAIIGLEFGRKLTAFRLQFHHVFNQHGPGKKKKAIADISLRF